MPLPPQEWFTEIAAAEGIAFSLRVRALLHEERSAFQHIAIYDTETFGRLMVIDGCTMVAGRDNFIYHEMLVHPALYIHPHPRRVAIIGGGDCGTLREVLRHAEVEEAIQVEIDERVTRLAERFFPELTAANGDPRARLLFEDGIAWMRAAPAASLDVVIVDSTDPVGPAEGLFNEAFYKECRRALRPGGLIVQQSESPLLHLPLLRAMRAALRRAGFAAVRTLHFPQPIYPSGWWSATLACKDGPIDGFREAQARDRSFETRYYTPEVHRAAFALPAFLERALREE